MDRSFSSLIQTIWSDANLFLMHDRKFPNTLRSQVGWFLKGSRLPRNMMAYQVYSLDVAKNLYDRLTSDPPPYLYLLSEPHNTGNYIRMKVADFLGIPIYIGLGSRIKNYRFISYGFNYKPEILPINASKLEQEKYLRTVDDYIRRVSRTYKEAIPEGEIHLAEKNGGWSFSLVSQFKRHWTRPSHIINGYLCDRRLRSLWRPADDLPDKYIVVFLHYQPERTSLPAGWGWTQQLGIVEVLLDCIPPDVSLVVKEHPGTFTRQCMPSVRWPAFYDRMVEDKRVCWVSNTVDNFDLLDKSLAVVTLTGTVVQEALLRGVPCITFGVQRGESVLGEHRFRTTKELRDFIKRISSIGLSSGDIIFSIQQRMRDDVAYVLPSNLAYDRLTVARIIEADLEKRHACSASTAY